MKSETAKVLCVFHCKKMFSPAKYIHKFELCIHFTAFTPTIFTITHKHKSLRSKIQSNY